jgi:hypothetical protein
MGDLPFLSSPTWDSWYDTASGPSIESVIIQVGKGGDVH